MRRQELQKQIRMYVFAVICAFLVQGLFVRFDHPVAARATEPPLSREEKILERALEKFQAPQLIPTEPWTPKWLALRVV